MQADVSVRWCVAALQKLMSAMRAAEFISNASCARDMITILNGTHYYFKLSGTLGDPRDAIYGALFSQNLRRPNASRVELISNSAARAG